MSNLTQGRRPLAVAAILVLATFLVAMLLAGCGGAATSTTAAQSTTSAGRVTAGGAATTAGAGTTAGSGTTAGASTTTSIARGPNTLILASTTSTQDSGLFDVLIPAFNKAYPNYDVKVVAVGSGEALTLGQTGNADVLLVHSPAAEEDFMKNGYGVDRKAVMYNDFIIVGPPADPAGIKGLTVATDAFKKIADAKALFYSRGDKSGTNTKELAIWKAAGITPSGDWYQTTGQGMGETLTICDQKGGYTLADRGTWLARKDGLSGLTLLVEGDKALFNQYHVITCKGAKNVQGANDFMDWIVSADVQQNIIGKFGVDKYGQQLFVPNAGTAQ
jgi:tungstate transport system substrate-binding protein